MDRIKFRDQPKSWVGIRGKVALLYLLVAFAILIMSNTNVCAIEKDHFSTSPITNKGQKWRIGYYEGGQYSDYYHHLTATVRALMELGWIEKAQLPEQKSKETQPVWEWLAHSAKSNYIEFVGDAYYNAKWDRSEREKIKTEIITRLNQKKDIDLMMALGTWAGKDLANSEHSTNTMVLSSSDPIKAGIIKGIEDSGYDHIHAHLDPLRYERQVRVFHDIIGFKKLGVAFEDSVYGRSYAAIDLVEKVAKERGFEVVGCHTQSDIADQMLAGESVIKCFKELAGKVDAIYLTVQGGVNDRTLPELVKTANENHIPTFAQSGGDEVEKGILLSISRAGFRPVGMFQAATMAKIFNGAKPGQLNQVFEEALNIAINLKTAEIIGIYLYADVLAAADEIYREIQTEEHQPRTP